MNTQPEQNIEHQFEESESRMDEYEDERYSEYDDYQDEPVFEKTSIQKGVQKFRY